MERKYTLSSLLFILTILILYAGSETLSFLQENEDSEGDNYFSKAEVFYNKAEYDSALYYYRLSAAAYLLDSDYENYIRAVLEEGHYYRINEDFDEANRLLKKVSDTAKLHFSTNSAVWADIYHFSGTLLADKGEFEASIPWYEKAIKSKIQIYGPKDTLLCNTYNNLGNTYFYLGEYNLALDHYQKALNIALTKPNKLDPELAVYHQTIAIINSIRGDFDQAEYHFNQSQWINEQTLTADDPDLALFYQNLGLFYNQTGKGDKALGFFERARLIYQKKFGSDYIDLGIIYLNEGNIFHNNGDYDKAVDFYRNALRIFTASLTADHPHIASVYSNLASVHFKKEEFKEAIPLYKKSIDINKERFSLSLLRAYRNYAKCFLGIGDTIQAEQNFSHTIDITKDYLGNNHFELGNAYLDYGKFLADQGDNDEGMQYYEDALQIFRQNYGDRHPDVSLCYSSIGDIHLAKKEYGLALKSYQRSLIAIHTEYSDSSIFSNPPLQKSLLDFNLLTSLRRKAFALQKAYYEGDYNINYLTESISTYTLAIELIDKIRSEYITEESKLYLGEKAREAYTQALNICIDLAKLKEDGHYDKLAFSFAEKSKSAVLLSSVRNNEALQLGGIPIWLQNIEQKLKSELAFYDKSINEENQKETPNQEKLTLWQKRLFDTQQKYDQLSTYLEENYPAFYSLKFDNTVFSPEDIQDKLDNESLIEYSLNDSLLIIFYIDKNTFSMKSILIDSIFYDQLLSFQQSVRELDFAAHSFEDFQRYTESAHYLYAMLIQPVEHLIETKSLIIVPDGILGYIPFEALTTEKAGNKMDYRSLKYLIHSYAVNYSYSSTLLYRTNQLEEGSKNGVLSFAPSYDMLHGENKQVPEHLREYASYLVPLRGAAKELENIKQYFDSESLKANLATESAFKSKAGEYPILHLAMHTIIDDENPMYSKLVFTVDADSNEDGLLHTYELYNMQLKARLAVLSACNTGSGKLHQGEGIMSLARGFIYAGCPSIVMTLWSVNDNSGVTLMDNFYKHLSKGERKDIALQNAKLSYLQEADNLGAHPFFWSAYVSIGNNEALCDNFKWNPYLMGGIALIIILMVLIIIRKRKKRS